MIFDIVYYYYKECTSHDAQLEDWTKVIYSDIQQQQVCSAIPSTAHSHQLVPSTAAAGQPELPHIPSMPEYLPY